MASDFDRTLAAIQIAPLPADVQGKNCVEAEQTLFSNLYFCLGERSQDELHNRTTGDLASTRNWRVLDEFDTVFKEKNRNIQTVVQKTGRRRDVGNVPFRTQRAGGTVRSGNAGSQNTTGCVYREYVKQGGAKHNTADLPKIPMRFIGSHYLMNKEIYAKTYEVFSGRLAMAPAGALQIKRNQWAQSALAIDDQFNEADGERWEDIIPVSRIVNVPFAIRMGLKRTTLRGARRKTPPPFKKNGTLWEHMSSTISRGKKTLGLYSWGRHQRKYSPGSERERSALRKLPGMGERPNWSSPRVG